ncbi:hypothetical protein [Bradyrhizobium arachidis]|uniref:Uncharacterized protein n=1 Tax=Bradyrhizobium arachidis TaxID=858423 RepID=A0AAE7NPP9_9BRAD|nr:hypothetical protein [Bradyrhizobium arachidis]QOZ69111.1 hypothetical protein WN72_24425 [Bradyrhizobium arachidis]SFV00824.1 hypothetical protein SAMN05192541_109263 [Bradyrhizobium arachidis]
MANRNGNISRPSSSNFDLAVFAKREVDRAGEDDTAYERAIVTLETAPATTPQGIAAKFDLLWSRIEMLVEDEDSLSVIADLARGIGDGLIHLQREAA